MGRMIDLTGRRFNRWVVLERDSNSVSNKSRWICRCDCGSIRTVLGCHLTNGNSKSCGCYKSETTSILRKYNLTGQKFGKLKVLKEYGKNNRNNYLWLCKCDCGSKSVVVGTDLKSGHTKSCGCYRSEAVSKYMKKDLTGKKFGRLTVVEECGRARTIRKQILYRCVCKCGNEITTRSESLTSGHTKSCGCYKIDKSKKRTGKNNPMYGKCGELNPNWKGGVSFEPYCHIWTDKEYKEDIKARDNYECQNPHCWGKNKRLTVYHIDYVKKNCHPDNLITLCNSCNTRANYNREYWKNLYRRQHHGR